MLGAIPQDHATAAGCCIFEVVNHFFAILDVDSNTD